MTIRKLDPLPDSPFFHEEKVPIFYIRNPAVEPFPAKNPPVCTRECERFFQSHGKVISFALYAPRDIGKQQDRIVCAYAFSCGDEIHGKKYRMQQGEGPPELIRRIASDLTTTFIDMAMLVEELDEKKRDFNA